MLHYFALLDEASVVVARWIVRYFLLYLCSLKRHAIHSPVANSMRTLGRTSRPLLIPATVVGLALIFLGVYTFTMFSLFPRETFTPGIIGDMFGFPNVVINIILAFGVFATIHAETSHRRLQTSVEQRRWMIEQIDYDLKNECSSFQVLHSDVTDFLDDGPVNGVSAAKNIQHLKELIRALCGTAGTFHGRDLPITQSSRENLLRDAQAAVEALDRIRDLDERRRTLVSAISRLLQSENLEFSDEL